MKSASLLPRLVLAASVVVISVSPVSAAAWVARHGLTEAQYQSEFEKWTGEGLRLRCVGGYSDGTSARYAAVWDNTAQTSWLSHHGMSATGVDGQVAAYTQKDLRLKFINMYAVGAQIQYAAIWEASSQLTTHRLGRSWSDFQSDHAALSAQGYQLESMSSCNLDLGIVPSIDLYAGVWTLPDPFGHIQEEHFRLTSSQYQAQFNTLAGQGYRLVCLTSCVVSGSVRYSGIWRKPFGTGWWSYGNLKAADYQTETENAAYQGGRTEYVSVHMVGGEPRFNAVWTGNGGMPFDCIGILDDGIRQFMEDNDTPGISLAIMKNGRLVFAKGYGQSDHVTGCRAGPLHRYRVASISKSVTAAAVLQLTEDTSLGLGDLVFGPGGTALGTQYGNGNYSSWERQITVQHLLTHRSGWTNDGPLWDNSYGQNHNAVMDWTLDSNNPSSQPGTMYQYMNLDYHALGRVIEEFSGQTYEAYCQAMLAQCGITTMELGEQTLAGRKAREVRYYHPSANPYVDIDPERMDANGGWIATPIDLLLFLRRIDNQSFPSDLLNSASRTAMRTGTMQNGTYGLGWSWDNARTWEGHNGCMTGTSSFLVNRSDGVAYAVLANKRTNCSWELKAAIDPLIDQLEAKNAWPGYNLFPAGTDYRSWVRLKFGATAASLALGSGFLDYVGPDGDPDNDKLTNAAEKYFGTDPTVADPSPVTVQRVGREIVMRWPCDPASGYVAEPRFSTDLAHWFADRRAVVQDVLVRGEPRTVKEVRLPTDRGGRLFAQLVVGEE